MLDALASADRPRLIVAGDYSAGKSSFVKRLLVESGAPVPDTLGIAAHPTTDRVSHFACGGWDLVDTPGFQSGTDAHAAEAHRALVGASVVLLLLNPNLVVGDPEDLRSVLLGDPATGRVGKLKRTVFVINRADELGVDPFDDMDAYEQLCARKELELTQAISALTGATPGTVLCVAGDPFGMVGDRRDVAAADYAQHRDWDGIAPLKETLLDPQGDLLRHGVDVMVLEAGAAQLGQIVARRREELATARQRLTQQRRLQLDLEACVTGGEAITGSARDELAARFVGFVSDLYDDIEATSDAKTRNARIERLEHWSEDDEFQQLYAEWVANVERKLEAWKRSTADRVERRVHSASFAAAFPSLEGAIDLGHLAAPEGPGATGVARQTGKQAVHGVSKVYREVVTDIAHRFGHKFQPWGATKLTNKIQFAGRAGGVAFAAWDTYQLVKSLQDESKAQRRAAETRSELLADARAAANDALRARARELRSPRCWRRSRPPARRSGSGWSPPSLPRRTWRRRSNGPGRASRRLWSDCEDTGMNEDWPSRVLDGIADIAGAPARDEVAARWAEHAAREKPEITVLGPYDAGKSSLIRRLLAEDEMAIPDWLTVSARRETFELNEVDGVALTYTDAPGFGSTVERHDAAAEDALAISDAFLLVVPPQLLTEHRGWVTDVLSGEHFFGRPGGDVARATIAVIAQADSLGIDPEDDLEGMRELAERKRGELIAQLGAGGAGLEVLVVAADPYEEQARTAQPGRADFEAFREWDGIDALRSALAAIAERSSELRAAAELRYVSRVGGMVRAEASAVAEQMEAAAADLSSRAAMFEQLRERVDGVVGAAGAELVSDLVSVGADAAEEVSPSDPGATAAVESRLAAVIGRWDERWTAELELVLGEASVEVEGRLARPSADRTGAFLRALKAQRTDDQATAANSRVIGILNDVKGQLDAVAKGTFELRLGERFDDAVKAARKVKHPKPQAGAAEKAGGFDAFKLQAGLQVLDGVLAIATTLDAERAQGKLEQKLREQREAARDKLQRAAETIAADCVGGEDGFRARATTGLNALRTVLAVPTDPSAIAALAEDARRQRERLDTFAALLAECPALMN